MEEFVAVEKNDAAASARIVLAIYHSVGKTGQPTAAHELLDTLLLQTARQKFSQFEVVEASAAVLGRVQYILGGNLTPVDPVVTASRGTFRLDLGCKTLRRAESSRRSACDSSRRVWISHLNCAASPTRQALVRSALYDPLTRD